MTNEEKAREIASKYFPVGSPHYTTEVAAQIDCQNAVNEMAKWKDQQLKDYLENIRNRFNNYLEQEHAKDYDVAASYTARLNTIIMIIEELFGETEEVDHSNNDE